MRSNESRKRNGTARKRIYRYSEQKAKYLYKTRSESSTSESVLIEAESDRRQKIGFPSRPASRELRDPREWKRDLHKPHPDSKEI